MKGVLDRRVDDCPIAVVDIETTGLYPRADRLVEISIVRWEPAHEPELVLDTLVNPERPIAATEIHGITDDDVADAPTFADLAGSVADSLSGAVVAAYNVYFDVRFLSAEFSMVRFRHVPPHLCLMYLRPMLGLGRRCGLADACRQHGIEHQDLHTASLDAQAGAQLWLLYLKAMRQLDIRTFDHLRSRKPYKFVESFETEPLAPNALRPLPMTVRFKPRGTVPPVHDHAESRRRGVHEYWDAVTGAVADLELSDQELRDLDEARRRLALSPEEIRAVHGRVFAGVLGDAIADSRVTEEEWEDLRRLHACLQELGWAPGM